MANIKTRERSIGSIKTIDRASVMTQHIRQATLKIKDNTIPDKRDPDSPESYAQQHVAEISKAGARRSAAATYEMSKETARRIHMKKDFLEIKKRKDILLRNRYSQPSANQTVLAVHSPKIKTPTEAQKKAAVYRKVVADKAKRQQAARTAVQTKDIARKSAHEARKTAQMVTRFARRIIEAGSIAAAWVQGGFQYVCDRRILT